MEGATETKEGPGAAPDASERGDGMLATWVWSSEKVLDAAERASLLEFVEREGVNTLFLQMSSTFETDAGFAELSAFVSEALDRDLKLLWVDGNPRWALPGQQRGAFRVLDRAVRLNTRLSAEDLQPLAGILYDVEPHLLPEWKTEEAVLNAGFVALMDLLQAEARTAGLEFWSTVPFWFADAGEPGGGLGGAALRLSAGVVIMAYRDSAEGVVKVASELFDLAASSPRPIVVAVETLCSQPEGVTFCGASGRELRETFDTVRAALGETSSFAGLAVHHYESWSELVSGNGQ